LRTLTYLATKEDEGRTVLSILRREFLCSESHISRLKRRETGLLLNGARCYVTARVGAGDSSLKSAIADDNVRWNTACRV
jgi:hypothetical protein